VKRLILLPGALDDLDDIRAYTIRTWGIGQAETYLGEMGASFRKIVAGEAISQPVEYRNLRKIRFRSHMIYFLEYDDRIEVVRILHASMDAERHLP
jgi:toxin ParE1/3/4